MSKFNLNKLTPLLDKAGRGLAKGGKTAAEIVRDKNFQKGMLSGALPTTVWAFFLIRKYKKQVEEKEALYKKALAKHNAVIKELHEKTEIDRERQNRLLSYDAQLKKKINRLQSEIHELKRQIDELKKEKADDE